MRTRHLGKTKQSVNPNLVTRNAGSVTMSGPTRTSGTEWRTTLQRQVLSLRQDKTNLKINNLNYNEDFLKQGNTPHRVKLLNHDWGSNKGYVLVQWRWWLSSSSEPYEASAWCLAASACRSHRENYIHTLVIYPGNKQQVHEMTYLQNEEAVTFSVRDRFCLVGMRPTLYLMWKNSNNNRLIKCELNKTTNWNMNFRASTINIQQSPWYSTNVVLLNMLFSRRLSQRRITKEETYSFSSSRCVHWALKPSFSSRSLIFWAKSLTFRLSLLYLKHRRQHVWYSESTLFTGQL